MNRYHDVSRSSYIRIPILPIREIFFPMADNLPFKGPGAISQEPEPIVLQGSRAEREQGWKPEYSLERMIADFFAEMTDLPPRYR